MAKSLAKSDWSFKTAVELSRALAARKVSAVELAQDTIGRIERHDGKINAICVRDFERGLASARVADAALARGETRPLLGIPMTVKESFNVAELPTTWGFPAQKDFIAAEDALPVSRVKDAGGVILGKTIDGLHQAMELALIAMIGVHVAAALAHRWIYRDRIMQRMLPG